MDFKLQTGRALPVVPSDTIDIPVPSSKVASGAQDSIVANELNDSTATFQTTGVKIGDVVHDTDGGQIATVSSVDSETTLTLSADIFTASENYVIYARTTKDCVIYVGVTGDVAVETSGGDSVMLKAVPAGMIIPLNVKRVDATSTTATDMVAMW